MDQQQDGELPPGGTAAEVARAVAEPCAWESAEAAATAQAPAAVDEAPPLASSSPKKPPRSKKAGAGATFAPGELTQEERRLQICLYLGKYVTSEGRLERGALEKAAAAFGCKYNGVRGVWARNKEAIISPDRYKLDVGRKPGQGRKQKYSTAEIEGLVQAAGPDQSLRALADRTGVPKSTLHRMMQRREGYKRKSNNPHGPRGKKAKAKAVLDDGTGRTAAEKKEELREELTKKIAGLLQAGYPGEGRAVTGSVRSLASQVGVSKSTVHRVMKRGNGPQTAVAASERGDGNHDDPAAMDPYAEAAEGEYGGGNNDGTQSALYGKQAVGGTEESVPPLPAVNYDVADMH